jgi:hypothetical protein
MTGISNPSADNQTVVFPNPAKTGEIIRLKSTKFKNQEVVVSVIDALGKIISKSTTTFDGFIDIKTANLSSGVYTLRLESGGEDLTNRVVVY